MHLRRQMTGNSCNGNMLWKAKNVQRPVIHIVLQGKARVSHVWLQTVEMVLLNALIFYPGAELIQKDFGHL